MKEDSKWDTQPYNMSRPWSGMYRESMVGKKKLTLEYIRLVWLMVCWVFTTISEQLLASGWVELQQDTGTEKLLNIAL